MTVHSSPQETGATTASRTVKPKCHTQSQNVAELISSATEVMFSSIINFTGMLQPAAWITPNAFLVQRALTIFPRILSLPEHTYHGQASSLVRLQ